MTNLTRLYDRADEWLRNLSHGGYAVATGVAAGSGVLVVGLLMSEELLLVQAFTIALTMFGLQYVFGNW